MKILQIIKSNLTKAQEQQKNKQIQNARAQNEKKVTRLT